SPRSLEALSTIGVAVEGAVAVGDLELLAGRDRSLRLPWPRGASYPDRAAAVPRARFDEQLRVAAANAGAEFVHGDLAGLEVRGGRERVTLGDGTVLVASFVVGADGALSRVAELAGLTTASDVLWGFALRYYVDTPVERGVIAFWEPERGRAFPGYGWVFPGADGCANLGLGVSTGASRRGADVTAQSFPAFVAELRRREVIGEVTLSQDRRRGGWLKLGLAGTRAASGQVLLVGDAAGAVNPLVGEGISGAILGGRDAAEAILSSPGTAASHYRQALARRHGAFHPTTAALHAYLAARPRLLSLTGRAITVPGLGKVLSESWSMYWNDLLDGAPAGRTEKAARAIEALTGVLTTRSRVRRRTEELLED
ncbi:MAG TPA: FAD-dependent monooxygenase, partial [Gaiellaceae bacterium]|nr:FAD-dependent monooxygenase [Gaiellaceae bacterium]